MIKMYQARRIVAGSFISAVLLVSSVAWPCTTFLMEEQGKVVIGKSYDWSVSVGLVVINKRGIEKTALILGADTRAKWISKYSSLTFNQHGRELPLSGMNEVGLVVEVMMLSGTQYPAADSRPAVNELQWVQYVLDNYQSVTEVVANAPAIRVAKVYANLHYLVCDLSGNCAAVEYLDGQLVITTGSSMPVKTLANDTYAASATYLKQFEGFGGSMSIPTGTGSLDRFVRASAMALDQTKAKTTDYGFAILDSVSQGTFSKWNLVYVPQEGIAYFRTHKNTKIKSVRLAAFTQDCSTPAKMLDIDTDATGNVETLFVDATAEMNKQLLEVSLKDFLKSLPEGVVDTLAQYPDQMICTMTQPATDGAPPVEASVDAGPAPDTTTPVADLASTPPATTPDHDDGGCRVVAAPWSASCILLGLMLLLLAGSARMVALRSGSAPGQEIHGSHPRTKASPEGSRYVQPRRSAGGSTAQPGADERRGHRGSVDLGGHGQ